MLEACWSSVPHSVKSIPFPVVPPLEEGRSSDFPRMGAWVAFAPDGVGDGTEEGGVRNHRHGVHTSESDCNVPRPMAWTHCSHSWVVDLELRWGIGSALVAAGPS